MIPGSIDLNNFPQTEYTVQRSLRFRASNTAYFRRTLGAASTSTTICTWSIWVKRGAQAAGRQHLFSNTNTAGSLNMVWLEFNSNQKLEALFNGGATSGFTTTQVFRDSSAWYHIVLTYDSTQATSTDRVKLYVNGVQVTVFDSITYPSLNQAFNAGIGDYQNISGFGASQNNDIYVSDVYFIDGQALTPSSFAYTNRNSQWSPRRYAGTYGTNGFFLEFKDATSTTTIAQDTSGNGNNFTASGISVTSGSTFDQMLDTPTNNYATLAYIDNSGNLLEQGNLFYNLGAGVSTHNSRGTIGIASGRWYWEVYPTGNKDVMIGIADITKSITAVGYQYPDGWYYWGNNGNKYNNNINSAYGASFLTTSVIGIALDMDAGTVTFYKDNVSQGQAYSGLTGKILTPCVNQGSASASTGYINFGQRAFTYTPPAGFKALCVTNLVDPTIRRPENYMTSVTYTGGSDYSWSSISAGPSHTAAIRSDGALFTWGLNNSGQLGINLTFARSSPIQIGTSSWSMVSVGSEYTCAIRSDGTLWSWGNAGDGRLGDNSIVSKSSPVQIGTSSWKTVSAGLNYTAAINIDNILFLWGRNLTGAIGNNTTVSVSSPVQIGSSSWLAVTVAGSGHSAALRNDGILFTWGLNSKGQLGQGDVILRSSPTQVGSSSWVAISVGSQYTSAIRVNGSLFMWGYNNVGQLGDNTITDKSSPIQIGSSSWVFVGLGSSHGGAVRFTGGLFTWGWNSDGRLGQTSTVNLSSPVQIGSSSWSSISAGDAHTIGILNTTTLFTWGTNLYGELGQTDTVYRSSPTIINATPRRTLSTRFQPDLLWIKSRNAATDHTIYDQVRGTQSRLESNNTDAEVTGDSGWLSATTENFTVGDLAQVNTLNNTYVSWLWDETPTAGFDIVSYAGDNTSNRNISHSLNVAPHFAIVKSQSTSNWWVWHRNLTGNTYFLSLNGTAAQSLTNTPWGTGNWSSTQFMVTNNATENANATSTNYIAYLWSEITGFSRFGSYLGNGSTDGPFVWCGFRPRWIMTKRANGSGNWMIMDTLRPGYNLTDYVITAESSGAENTTGGFNRIDILSTGFKVRDSSAVNNFNGETYIFAAFAEIPFKYARAR